MHDREQDDADTSRPGARSRIVIFAAMAVAGLVPLGLLSVGMLRKVVHGPVAFEQLERIDGIFVSAEPCRPHETYAVDLDGVALQTYATHVTGWRSAQMRLLAVELVLTSGAIALLAWLFRNYFGEAAGGSKTR